MIISDDTIFTQYEMDTLQSKVTGSNGAAVTNHIMFDSFNNFKDLSDDKMDNHLSQQQFKNITPWRALTEIIAIPVVMLAFIVAVKIHILIKIIVIFMVIVHIIISTCFVSYLSKNYNAPLHTNNDNSNATISNIEKIKNKGD